MADNHETPQGGIYVDEGGNKVFLPDIPIRIVVPKAYPPSPNSGVNVTHDGQTVTLYSQHRMIVTVHQKGAEGSDDG